MKRFWIGLLALLLLAGCGAPKETPEEQPPEEDDDGTVCGLLPSEPGHEGLYMMMEREVYDPSLTTFTYFVVNHGEETIEFGEPYRILRWTEEGYQDLTPKENWAFLAIGYMLAPGKTMALTCTLDRYEEPPEPGEYLLVKDLGNGNEGAARIYLGDSIYTADTPYGFGPLEELPEDYGPVDAADTAAVCVSGRRVVNLESARVFLQEAFLGVPCQLRTVQDYGQNEPMIIDVIRENGHYLWRMRHRGYMEERRYAYIVSDGTDVYLSNGADWENTLAYKSDKAFLLPENLAGEELVQMALDKTAERLESNSTRYELWSDDGVWCAALLSGESPTEFSVSWQRPGEGSAGSVYDLQDWDGVEASITELEWRTDGLLAIRGETTVGNRFTDIFDPETEKLTALTGEEIRGLPLAPADTAINP